MPSVESLLCHPKKIGHSSEDRSRTVAVKKVIKQSQRIDNFYITIGCCQKKSTSYCCYATFILGVIFLILGLVVLVGGQSILNEAILKTMALHKDTERSVTQ